MSKKLIQQYICQACGSVHPRWNGKCTDCGEWNSLVEEVIEKPKKTELLKASANDVEIYSIDSKFNEAMRTKTGMEEFDRVLGGGLVRSSAILLGGDPGIGKSTLVLQVLSSYAKQNLNVLYISGEEAVDQIKLRASRLNVTEKSISICSATQLSGIVSTINSYEYIDLVVIDSIQTIYDENIESAPGSVSQVRSCSFELIQLAKRSDFALIIIGHVTKEGNIAGPKVLEHMVDTVLYFEGDNTYVYRMIRAIKNRFGAANEIAVFEMTDTGLKEVSNPSQLFLPTGGQNHSGSCIFAGIEGTRPILMEVQALIVPSFLASPRRAVIGWDANRLAMLIAVLNARLGINILDKEVYLNIAGGLRINEPALDLAVVAALISCFKNAPIPRDFVIIGEVGLSGEVRNVSQISNRLKEAEKLGFTKAIIPKSDVKISSNLDIFAVNHINNILDIIKN
jgi:DNA repair protein RadA/Sms